MSKQKELLFSLTRKDFVVEPYKGSGKGGQHRNKTMSCIRIKHTASGAEAIGTEHREQRRNRSAAFRRLVATPTFKAWHKQEVSRLLHGERELDRKIEEALSPQNIKTELWDSEMGKWVKESEKLKEKLDDKAQG